MTRAFDGTHEPIGLKISLPPEGGACYCNPSVMVKTDMAKVGVRGVDPLKVSKILRRDR